MNRLVAKSFHSLRPLRILGAILSFSWHRLNDLKMYLDFNSVNIGGYNMPKVWEVNLKYLGYVFQRKNGRKRQEEKVAKKTMTVMKEA